jgi:hypothetical protein
MSYTLIIINPNNLPIRHKIIKLNKKNNLTNNFTEIISIIEKAKSRIYKAINSGLIEMYNWEVGEHISLKVAKNRWGEGIIQEFSRYLQLHYLDIKGVTPLNLWCMKQFLKLTKICKNSPHWCEN